MPGSPDCVEQGPDDVIGHGGLAVDVDRGGCPRSQALGHPQYSPLVLLLEHLLGWEGRRCGCQRIVVRGGRRGSCCRLLSLNIITPREGTTPLNSQPGLKEFTFDWWKVLLCARHPGGKQSGTGLFNRESSVKVFGRSRYKGGKRDSFVVLYLLPKFSTSFKLKGRHKPTAVLMIPMTLSPIKIAEIFILYYSCYWYHEILLMLLATSRIR